MAGGFDAIGRVEDIPFVARHARADLLREDVLTGLDVPPERPLALSSFGHYGVNGLDMSSLDCLEDWTVVITGNDPPSTLPDGVAFVKESRIYDQGLRYEDLVAASDVVVTKPGYGIISECIANQTAMLYTSRGHFAGVRRAGEGNAPRTAVRVHRPGLPPGRPLAGRRSTACLRRRHRPSVREPTAPRLLPRRSLKPSSETHMNRRTFLGTSIAATVGANTARPVVPLTSPGKRHYRPRSRRLRQCDRRRGRSRPTSAAHASSAPES